MTAVPEKDNPFRSGLAASWRPYLISRLFIAVFVYLGHLAHPFQEKIEGGYAGVSNWFLNPWTYFDSAHFFSIARLGYTPETTPFFPLYPLLLRPFGPGENGMALAGVLISNLAFLGALLPFFVLTQQQYGEAIARRSVWLLCFFPAAVFGMAVYTESVFLLLGLLAFWSARQHKWLLAALFAFLAALTRNYGPVLAVALGFEWLRQRRNLEKPAGTAFVAVAAPLLAFVAVQLTFARQFGGALSGVASQSNYFRAPTWPWLPIWRDAVDIASGQQLNLVAILNLAATLLAIYLLWKYRKKAMPFDMVLLGGVLLMHLTLARTIPPYTNGSLRYVFGIWPFTQLLALECEIFTTNKLRLVAGWSIYLLLGAVHSYLFGLKSFLG